MNKAVSQLKTYFYILLLIALIGPIAKLEAQYAVNINQKQTQENTVSSQESYWDEFQTLIQPVESFVLWQNKTREIPPNFSKLSLALTKFPQQVPDPDFSLPTPFIPDPLRGFLATSKTQTDLLLKIWNKRREEIIANYTWWVLGSSPPPPQDIIPIIASGSTSFLNCFAQKGILKMGEDIKAEINVEMLFPRAVPQKIFPVIILPLRQQSAQEWAQAIVARGCIVCLYERGLVLDGRSPLEPGRGTNAVQTLSQWVNSDWGELCKESWTLRRVIDYLNTFPQIDKNRIALLGEDFYAKAAIAAAAVDTRISATLAFSPGLGGFTPFRSHSGLQMKSGIEGITREHPTWFHPRLRFFAGKESYLPFEQTDLVACICPRSLYVATLQNNPEESLWANEMALDVLRHTYMRLGAPAQRIFLQSVDSIQFSRMDKEYALDWLEYQWGGKKEFQSQKNYYPSYEDWVKLNPDSKMISPITYPKQKFNSFLSTFSTNNSSSNLLSSTVSNWKTRAAEIQKNIHTFLGQPPPLFFRGSSFSQESINDSVKMQRNTLPDDIKRGGLQIPNGAHIDFYLSDKNNNENSPNDFQITTRPVLFWLPGFDSSSGYTYHDSQQDVPYFLFAREGFLVVTFDYIGCGTRINEIEKFYDRYPSWSIMGKIVQDVNLAMDAITQIPTADTTQIYLVGYGIGSLIALHVVALNPAVSGVISIGIENSLRFNTRDSNWNSLLYWTQNPLFIPQLGVFTDYEERLPYDINELMALVAPRPLHVIFLKYDPFVQVDNRTSCINSVQKIYTLLDAKNQVKFEIYPDYNHYSSGLNQKIIQSLHEILSQK
ncbi:MAG: hypothetical protein IKW70_06460 [Verrucomicrobia bacterium]|nr:hypothetical protein [Verrucomicrobiota bacterium]